MEKLGVLKKVEEPTVWVNFLVVVEKPTTVKLRLCLDPRHLNKAIQREQLPTTEDISTHLTVQEPKCFLHWVSTMDTGKSL